MTKRRSVRPVSRNLRRPTAEAEVSANGRERLLEAAIELFGRDGFEGTSVRTIADRAGVSFALIRVSYGSKEGLRDAAEQAVFSEVLPLWKYAGDVSSGDDIVSFIRSNERNFRRIRANIEFFRRCVLEQRPAANEFLSRVFGQLSKLGSSRLNDRFPHENAWLLNPVRWIVLGMGYFLLAPNIKDITGIDLLSADEIERINMEEARIWALIEAGLARKNEQAPTASARAGGTRNGLIRRSAERKKPN